VCSVIGLITAKYLYDEFKNVEIQNIVFVDPANGNLSVNMTVRSDKQVSYICSKDINVNQDMFVKWSEYRIRHPITGFFIWKLLRLPKTTTYSFAKTRPLHEIQLHP
jgi:hypothetical protein